MPELTFCVHLSPRLTGVQVPCEFCHGNQQVCAACLLPVACSACWEEATPGDLAELHLDAWTDDA